MSCNGSVVLRNFGIAGLLFVAGIAAAFGFDVIGLEPEASFLLFILCILIVSIETDSGFWGIGLGVLYLLVYDLFFTVPRMALPIFNRNDAITLVIFAIVAFITGALARRMKQQVGIAERNAAVLRRLNTISTGLIDSTSAEGACAFAASSLSKMLVRPVEIDLGRPDGPDAAVECFDQGYQTGAGLAGFSGETMRYLPLSGKGKTFGVVSIDCSDGNIDRSSKSFLDSVITQTVIAIERNELEEHAREDEMRIERERFKTTLLQSVSHDLRTPLAGIQGNAELLQESEAGISEEQRRALLTSISCDARSLAEMIDNLLSMTRVQDEDVPLDFQPEVIDDVVGDAVIREMPYRGEHEISVSTPDDVVLVPMDGKLIRQVIVNLIDNAIKHSSRTSRICVSAEQRGDNMVVCVSDDDGGIAPDMIDKVFGRFVSDDSGAGRSGIGLGLSICKAIVDAHGGAISARNNPEGGATFEFSLPMCRECEDGSCGEDLEGAAILDRGTKR